MPFSVVKFPQCTNVLTALYIIHVTDISSVHWIYTQQRFDFSHNSAAVDSNVQGCSQYFQQHTTPIPYVCLKHALNQLLWMGIFKLLTTNMNASHADLSHFPSISSKFLSFKTAFMWGMTKTSPLYLCIAYTLSLLLKTLKTFLIQIHGLHIMFHRSKSAVKTELFSVDLQVDLSKYHFAQEENAWDEDALSQHNDYSLCKCSNHISSSKTFITKLHVEQKKFLKNSNRFCYDECKWWAEISDNFEASKIANPHSYVSCPGALISSLILLWHKTS